MHVTSGANGTEAHTEWNAVDWQQANRHVRNLRQRIFRATQEGNWKQVRSLQKLMLRSHSNRLVSVRRVTQTSTGRKTPGVDKLVIKTPAARGNMVDQLAHYTPWKAKPARRVYIPKANGKLRPLGIPVITDRCIQAMVKNALEPSWEARFEGSSYGFRPGRGCHDAIEKIYGLARPNKRKKWVLDADIKGAFDNIDHAFLLRAIGDVPGKELIKQWLKAGYMEKGTLQATEAGTPQGGVISPLLANIALHGMETALGVKYRRGQIEGKRAVVRYADDFVVFCEPREDAEEAKTLLTEWLKERGLMLSAEKTKIVHLSEGFNFLGFNIRQYKAPLTSKTGCKLLTKPSKEAVQKLRNKLKDEWAAAKGGNVPKILMRLNPIIRGWANYFRTGTAKATFGKIDEWMYYKEVRFVKHTHPMKSKAWTQKKYWGKLNADRNSQWVFGDKLTGVHLLKFSWFPIERHILVKGNASPDDPSLKDYWKQRNMGKAKDLAPSKQKLARKQRGICPECGETLFNEEQLQVHHMQPRSQGGKDVYSNLYLVHLLCHQHIHSKAGNEQTKLCQQHDTPLSIESKRDADRLETKGKKWNENHE